jgi:hypothetical protein
MTDDIPNLPDVRAGGGWPVLDRRAATLTPYAGVSSFEEQAKVARRNRRTAYRQAYWQDFKRSIPKGALLGFLVFAVVYGLAPDIQRWWAEAHITLPTSGLADWRAFLASLTPTASDWASALPWVIPVLGAVSLAVIFGSEMGIAILAVACIALSVPAVPQHALALVGYICIGIVLRGLYELAP